MLAVMANGQLALFGAGGLSTPQLWERWLASRATTSRFIAKVYRRDPGACWYWLGALGSDGHGRFRAGSRGAGTSWVVTAHVFAYQHAYGLCMQRLMDTDVVIRHRCDEASCQNPEHLLIGTAADNTGDYCARRHRIGGPLTDLRGTAGRAIAIREAILTTRPHGPAATDTAIRAAITAGDLSANQPSLFGRDLTPVADFREPCQHYDSLSALSTQLSGLQLTQYV
jgi:hypothetical protein